MSPTAPGDRPSWVPERLPGFPQARLAYVTRATAIFEDPAGGTRRRIQIFSRKVAAKLAETQDELESWAWSIPGICRIYRVVHLEGLLGFVADWVGGDPLGSKKDSPVPLAAGLRLVRATARILARLEAHPEAVRVWKPGQLSPWSLWVDEGESVWVDPPALATAESAAMALRRPNRHLAYLAPEQVLGREVDLRTDLYILGVMAYELLAGAHPFLADTSSKTIQRVTAASPPPPSAHAPWIPKDVDAAILAALRKDPARRPSSFSIWAHMLQEALLGAVPEAQADGRGESHGLSLADAVLGIPEDASELPTQLLDAATAAEEPTVLLEQPGGKASGTAAAISHPELATASTRTRSSEDAKKPRKSPSWTIELLLGIWLLAALIALVSPVLKPPPSRPPPLRGLRVARVAQDLFQVETPAPGQGGLLVHDGRCLAPIAAADGPDGHTFWFRSPTGHEERFCLRRSDGTVVCAEIAAQGGSAQNGRGLDESM